MYVIFRGNDVHLYYMVFEMRKLRAEERKVEKENTKIDNKISEMEKKKEIMKLHINDISRHITTQ